MQDEVDRSLHVICRPLPCCMELELFHTYNTLYTLLYQEDIILRFDRARSHCFGTHFKLEFP